MKHGQHFIFLLCCSVGCLGFLDRAHRSRPCPASDSRRGGGSGRGRRSPRPAVDCSRSLPWHATALDRRQGRESGYRTAGWRPATAAGHMIPRLTRCHECDANRASGRCSPCGAFYNCVKTETLHTECQFFNCGKQGDKHSSTWRRGGQSCTVTAHGSKSHERLIDGLHH